jgi:hypothetical protein
VNVIDIWKVIQINSKNAGQKLQAPSIDSSTASCTEDSGSLSSVSTQQLDDSTSEDRRPIITQYLTREQLIQVKGRHSSLPSSISFKQQKRTDGIAEPSEDAEDNDGGDGPERHGAQRSIFGNCYARHSSSAGSLPTIPDPTPIIIRRAKSPCAFPDNSPPSCLRRKSDRPRRLSPSVSFAEKVDIVLFQRPQETWSAEGWSKLFAL